MIGHSSKSIGKEIIKRGGYVPHIPYKRKRGQPQQEQEQNMKTSKKNNLYAKNKR
jgi:hypothetical protein